jgi:hypothetical protein
MVGWFGGRPMVPSRRFDTSPPRQVTAERPRRPLRGPALTGRDRATRPQRVPRPSWICACEEARTCGWACLVPLGPGPRSASSPRCVGATVSGPVAGACPRRARSRGPWEGHRARRIQRASPYDAGMAPRKPGPPDVQACPLLGLAGDPRTRYTFPHPGHRCHATDQPSVVDLARQSSFCLSSTFEACELYKARPARPPGLPGTPQPLRARPPTFRSRWQTCSSRVRHGSGRIG